MRKLLARLMIRLANWFSPDLKYESTPKDQHDAIERLRTLIDKVNGTLYQVPRKYSLWMVWDAEPPQLVLRIREGAETHVIYPKRHTQVE
ncbi:MAG: hypothetical protein KKH61_21220 [Gammaproteobacteria bacterium]|uniref:Uncharacterized protein n=2 Tax=viral metagenome TaxID=1070528 RepID=A0A6H1ZBH8_9ZZZZ|nr:hypothetical protein [Gammaproteobacteria bacterium]